MKKYLLALLIIFSCAIIFAPALVLAQTATEEPVDLHGLDETAEKAGLATSGDKPELTIMIGNIIRWGLGLLGIIFMLLILIGGFQWMTAGGNEDKVKKAKSMIIAAFSGIVIVFLSYVLSSLVIEALINSSAS